MLILIRQANSVPNAVLASINGAEAQLLFAEQIRQWAASNHWWKFFKKQPVVYLYTPVPQLAPDSFKAMAAAYFLGRKAFHLDHNSTTVPITLTALARCFCAKLKDKFLLTRYLAVLDKRLTHLEEALSNRCCPTLPESGSVAYLRPDLIADLKAGGSVAHISGVINCLPALGYSPVFYSVENLPLVKAPFHQVYPFDRSFWSHEGLSAITFSSQFAAQVLRNQELSGKTAFIYQRHGLNTWAGAQLALELNCPFVLEYNGSEVWVARNWGTPIAREDLGLRVESLSLQAADLIVVVSDVLRDELISRGYTPDKIISVPNGVDTDAYSPHINGEETRQRLKLGGKLIVGFIGTFGKWHGAEKLAEAWGLLTAQRPDLVANSELLFIGDGLTVPATKKILAQHKARAIYTGTVSQAQGPAHLAACDILVAPHVPNSDGSQFFGSPTKLFEYMAMGKAIAASNLDQLGKIIENGVTGLLTEPGNAKDLSRALETLLESAELRMQLGAAARERALAQHTWISHTEQILDALHARASAATIIVQ